MKLSETAASSASCDVIIHGLAPVGPERLHERLQYAFRRCLSRRPSPQEANDLLGLLHKETRRFEDGTLDPWDLLGASAAMSPLLPKSLTPAQLAGWTAVSRVLLNVDETITKE